MINKINKPGILMLPLADIFLDLCESLRKLSYPWFRASVLVFADTIRIY